MHYVLSTSYSFDQIEDSLIAINIANEQVVIFGEVERFILKNIQIMSEDELIALAQKEYGYNEAIAADIHCFIISLVENNVIEIKENA